jgi:hypothetical protein
VQILKHSSSFRRRFSSILSRHFFWNRQDFLPYPLLVVIHSSRLCSTHFTGKVPPDKVLTWYIHISQVNMQAIRHHCCENCCVAETFLAPCWLIPSPYEQIVGTIWWRDHFRDGVTLDLRNWNSTTHYEYFVEEWSWMARMFTWLVGVWLLSSGYLKNKCKSVGSEQLRFWSKD